MSSDLYDFATAAGIGVYLQDKCFAAHTVKPLSGGLGNFTYRIYLHTPIDGRSTFVLKYAPPYVAVFGEDFPLDQKRQVIEVNALRMAREKLSKEYVSSLITVPAVHFFDDQAHVIIIDDAGEDSLTLKALLIDEHLPKMIAEQIGTALGEFISAVHAWHRTPDTDLTLFANNQVGKKITSWVTYERLESTLVGKDEAPPALTDPPLQIPEDKLMTISKLAERRQKAIYAASASDPMTHGDFWPGNIVLSVQRGSDRDIEGVEKVYVLDWEVSKTGLPGLDLGQLCAELYTLSEFFPARKEAARAVIRSFLAAYKERAGTRDVELARVVVSHTGGHLVALTPRVGTWNVDKQKTREVVEQGVELLVLGEDGSEESLRGSIIEPLL